MTLLKLMMIGLGGAAGTLARYATTGVLLGVTQRTLFPWGTLAVNAVGCLVIGYLHGLFSDYRPFSDEYRLAITVGFLGGYTTFSTFGLETMNFLHDAQYLRAVANVLLNNIGGLAMVMLGYGIQRLQA